MTDIIQRLQHGEATCAEARTTIFDERKRAAEMLNLLVEVNTICAGLDQDALDEMDLTDIADRIAVFLKRKAQS